MKFVQDAGKDLKTFKTIFARGKEQIAFARYGDGEERMYLGGVYHCTDGWISKPDKNSAYRKKLGEAIRFEHPACYLGLRWPRGLKMWAWTARNVKTPPDRICDPCLFVNSRWADARKFFKAQRKRCFLVGSGKGVDFSIPHNCIQPEFEYAKLLALLLKQKKPILLAAGPLANILVMEYLKAGGAQSIIDIGTVLDLELFGKATRLYQRRAMKKKRKRKRKPGKKAKRKARKKRPAPRRKNPTVRRVEKHLAARKKRSVKLQRARRHK